MSYRQGSGRRTVERRVYADPRHNGPERRKPAREPRSKIGLVIGAIAALTVADAAIWHGQYRHELLSAFNSDTGAIRQWSAHIWDMGST